ncbi:tRNA(Ile)-lysidine synthase [Halioglobus japonicus]|nr:tRNA(Ile)-lysidine synthase [Halioglobus japonicus]
MLHYTDLDTSLNELLAAPHWYVAYSGGLDSTVLLHLLQRWCAANPTSPPLRAIHVNHGLQAAANSWQQHCETQCLAWQVPCVTCAVQVAPRGSLEAAARDARYRAFEEQLPEGAVLFMGHHLDDQIETFFLRLMRGAGVEGLAGMPRQRNLGGAELVRPLLDFARAELERYAQHHDLAFVEDPSNQDTAMDRNYLRAELLPVLSARWPSYRNQVARAMAHLASASEAVATAAGVPETVHSVMGDPGVHVSMLLDPAAEVAAARLRAWLSGQGAQAPDRLALQEFLRQLRVAPADGSPRLDCGSYALRRYRDTVYLEPGSVAPAAGEVIDLAPGESCHIAGVGTLSLERQSADALHLVPGERLSVRWRAGGERCRLPGRAGSRSLKALMQEWQVPPWWRSRVPLVYLGDELLAVGDLTRCESSRWQAEVAAGEPLWAFRWKRPVGASSD